jgi:hypothetical protein
VSRPHVGRGPNPRKGDFPVKLLALGLIVAFLLHFPHLFAVVGQFATVAASVAAYALTYGLGHAWTLGLALALVLWHLGARRMGWAR